MRSSTNLCERTASTQYNLFPHLSVLDNRGIAPMLVLGQSSDGSEYDARAVAMRPGLSLFNEVMSALDPETVVEILTVVEGTGRWRHGLRVSHARNTLCERY
jgi:ABC-type polar amino acid transport system ATPase subunit